MIPSHLTRPLKMPLVLPLVLSLLLTVSACRPRHSLVQIHTPLDRKGQVLRQSPLLFQVRDGRSKYFALAGPLEPHARGVRAYVRQSKVFLGVESGWLYIAGRYPRGETTLVNAGATGTTMIMASYAERDRVIFLCADGDEEVVVNARLETLGGTEQRELRQRWHYIDALRVGDQVQFTEIKPIPAEGSPDPDGVLDLLQMVNEARQEAGLEGWCDPPGGG